MTKELTYEEALEKLTNIADSLDKKQDELSPEMSEIISALTKVHKNDISDDNWDDLFAMFDDIREHSKNNGRVVIEEDRPHQLRLAWRCTNTNKTWSIRIANVKKSLNESDPSRKELMGRAIMTQDGKIALTASLNSKE
jgi:hypothetical protein